MITKSLLIIPILISFININLLSQKNITGIYIGSESNNKLIINNDGSFTLLNKEDFGGLLPLWKIDTISYGLWTYMNDFLVLNTPDSINRNVIRMSIEELNIQNFDSVRIEINSPYERYLLLSKTPRVFKYKILIFDYRSGIEKEIDFYDNNITFAISAGINLDGLMVWIIPDSYLYPNALAFNYLQTDYYQLSNPESNVLKIFLPDFSLEYIGYLRFKEEYVRIGRRSLLLRGETFKKDISK